MDKNRIQGVSVGRAAYLPQSPYPSSTRSVDPAIVRGRRLNLPREICFVPRKRLSLPQGRLTAEQKSAEGVVCAEQRVVQEGSSPSGDRMRITVSKSGGNASLAEGKFLRRAGCPSRGGI